MTTALAEVRIYVCPVTHARYQPRAVRIVDGVVWCACPLHDATDHRIGTDGYHHSQAGWHAYRMDVARV